MNIESGTVIKKEKKYTERERERKRERVRERYIYRESVILMSVMIK